ncbi:hypothetical protein BH09PLA1_BH09PLA1_35060 [soil metagenome]
MPINDPYFDPLGTGTQVIPFTRSQYLDSNGVRQQVNSITAYIDGSMVYGSDAATAASLRTLVGGKLKTSAGNLLPLDAGGFFMAGDVRANENIELTAVQTLLMREHNRLATQLQSRNPTWNDERIYQQARRLVIGEIQAITYNEFLPALLGPNALRNYTGYKSNVNAGIANEFSTAGFRLGHSMLANDVEFISNDGEEAADEVELRDAFFNPTIVLEQGVDTILKYLASSNSSEVDNQIVDGVRNFLFTGPGEGGFDLASLNIQRGRDHGLSDYNDTRAALGLPRVTSFAQINPDPAVQAALQSVYASVDDIDLWAGGLAEKHVAGSNLGATFQRIVADQFTRSRDGDRFWYERDLSRSDLALVRNTRLSDLIRRNSTMSNLQDNVFVFDVTVSGTIFNDRNGNGNQDSRERGMSGMTVELLDQDGLVIDSTVTSSSGNYSFDFVQIGDFTVRPVLPVTMEFTTAGNSDIDVTRGQCFSNVRFGVRAIGGTFADGDDFDASADEPITDISQVLDQLA